MPLKFNVSEPMEKVKLVPVEGGAVPTEHSNITLNEMPSNSTYRGSEPIRQSQQRQAPQKARGHTTPNVRQGSGLSRDEMGFGAMNAFANQQKISHGDQAILRERNQHQEADGDDESYTSSEESLRSEDSVMTSDSVERPGLDTAGAIPQNPQNPENAQNASGLGPEVSMQPLTQEQRRQKKYELLSKLQALERKGVALTKKFTTKHRLTDIQSEYDRVSKTLTQEAGVKFGRKALMAFVTGMEYTNKSFDPIGAKLEGWSESVMENVEDYDHAMSRIVDKWSSHVEVAPEMELFMALTGSAFMFHLSKSLLQNPASLLQSLGQRAPNMMENMMKSMMRNQTEQQQPTQNDVDISPPEMNLNPLQHAGDEYDSDETDSTADDGDTASSVYSGDTDTSKQDRPKARIFTVPNKSGTKKNSKV